MANSSSSGRILLRFATTREFLLEYADGISKGVVFVPTPRPAPFGAMIDLGLALPGTDIVVPLSGNVAVVVTSAAAARNGTRAGMGVRFGSIPPEWKSVLVEFVRSQQLGRVGRVLLVDDDALALAQETDVLSAEGFAVSTATSGKKALELMKAEPFDLVVADVNMPHMDGFEFRARVREDPALEGVAFAFLTADGRDEARRMAAQHGVRRFLVKPLVPEQLLRIAREAAAERSAQAPAQTPARPAGATSAGKRRPDIAFRKMTALGMACRFSADGQAVEADVMFRPGRMVHAFSGAPITSGTMRTHEHDRAYFVKPPHLAALAPFPIHDFADGAAFETAVVRAYIARGQEQEKIRRLLSRFSVPTEFDEAGFQVLGRLSIMEDVALFALVDAGTIRVEKLNGIPLEGLIAAADRLADITDATSGIDFELALEPVVKLAKPVLQKAAAARKMTSPLPPSTRGVISQELFGRPGEFDLSEEGEMEAPGPQTAQSAPVTAAREANPVPRRSGPVRPPPSPSPAPPVQIQPVAPPPASAAAADDDFFAPAAPRPAPAPPPAPPPVPPLAVAPPPAADIDIEPLPPVVAAPLPAAEAAPPEAPAEPRTLFDPTNPIAPDRIELMCATCGGSYTIGLEVGDERLLTECPACIRQSLR